MTIFEAPVIFPREGRVAPVYGPNSPTAVSLAQHMTADSGRLRDLTRIDMGVLLEDIERLHLDGRGGAHFPSHVKIHSAIQAGPGGIAVANAAEGEPASAKDSALWFLRPHLVLDGLQLAARLINAAEAVVWVHDTAKDQIAAINAAIRERRISGRDQIRVRVAEAPDRYVSGQSHAIVNALQGGPAVPRFRHPGERAWGHNQKPILVHNTETLARLAAIAAGEAPDNVLLTYLQGDQRVVIDVPHTVTFRQLLAGQPEPSALLLGGYAGTWTSWEAVADLPLAETVLRQYGLSLGAGIIIPLRDECPLQHAADLADWLAGESARQCGPCLYGTADLADDVERLARGRLNSSGRARLAETLALLPKRGGCSLPDGAAAMVSSALTAFPDEVALHFDGRCSHTEGRLKKRKNRANTLPGAEVSAWTK